MDADKQKTIDELIDEIKSIDVRMAMFIGSAGTGKTTMIANLTAALSPEFTVGIVDADIGQSHLGPPATVAWGRIMGGFPGWESIPVESFYFTGAISPTGNLLQLVTGVKLMTDQALEACDKVLVDTTGLVTGSAAMALKEAKIDLLRPDMVIAIQRDDELSPVLDACRFLKRPRVVAPPVSPEARYISPAERSEYRRQKFYSYFTGAHVMKLSLKDTALRFTRGELAGDESFRGLLASLRDSNNTDLALGIIEDVEDSVGTLLIRTPLARAADRVAMMLVSELKAVI